MNVRFTVGIDLGTSNSAVAVGDIESGDTKIVEIGQIVGPNQLGHLPLRGVSAAQRIVQLTKASGFYKRITRIRRADMPTWGKGVLSLDAIYSYVRDSVLLSLAPGRNG